MATTFPFERTSWTGKFKPAAFQEVDLQQLTESPYSANWSEMGCYKTTTAEFLFQRVLEGVRSPRVLIVTTKSGKGAYYETLHEVLNGPDNPWEYPWEFYTVGTKQFNMVINGRVVPFNVNLPDPSDPHPSVVIAHYNCFTNNACTPQIIREPKWVIDSTGARIPGPAKRDPETEEIMYKVPRLNAIFEAHWDFGILDEAHRIKNPDAQWSQNIKKLGRRIGYRHLLTGTGFINDPTEIHNLLEWLGGRELVPARNKFRDKYCLMENKGGFWKVA